MYYGRPAFREILYLGVAAGNTCVGVHASVRPEVDVKIIFLNHFLHCIFWDLVSHWIDGSPIYWLDRLASGLLGSPISGIHRFFNMSAGDLNSEPHACAGSTLATMAPPLHAKMSFALSYVLCSPPEEPLVSNCRNTLSCGPGLNHIGLILS